MKLFTQISIGNILLIDDDKSLVDFLCLNLNSEGYNVNVSSLPSRINSDFFADVNLIILDSDNNPEEEIELIKRLRANSAGVGVGIIYCSDFGDEYSLIGALDAGADDCIRKPFSLRELLARIRAIIRRRGLLMEAVPSNILRFKGLTLNTKQKTASIDNEALNLSNTEFAILALLMKNAGSYTTRENIFHSVWQNNPGSNERIVDTNISRLRRKLGDLATNLVNRPNKGYTLTE